MAQGKNVGFFCSRLSREADEELFGTASRADVWFLLEYADAWAEKAFKSCKIPEPVKERLSSHLDIIPDSRILLIKQSSRLPSHIAFYVALTRELNPVIYKFSLESYEDLLSLDIAAILSGSSVYDGYIFGEPLFLVCTNGNRDRCCAKLGLQVYRELAKHAGCSAWQCTHVGGHRFAANVLCFPHGIFYGRVGAGEASALIREYRNGKIYNLEKYRGRSCYDSYVQASDYFLRSQTEARDISRFGVSEVQGVSRHSSAVRFSEEEDKRVHSVYVSVEKPAFKNYLSCGDDEKSDVDRYYLIEYKVG